MKRIQCPCCGYYTHDEDFYLFEFCDVCKWQYDEVVHKDPDLKGGANKISLNEARENYKKYGVCDLIFLGRGRKPLPEELPENNIENEDKKK